MVARAGGEWDREAEDWLGRAQLRLWKVSTGAPRLRAWEGRRTEIVGSQNTASARKMSTGAPATTHKQVGREGEGGNRQAVCGSLGFLVECQTVLGLCGVIWRLTLGFVDRMLSRGHAQGRLADAPWVSAPGVVGGVQAGVCSRWFAVSFHRGPLKGRGCGGQRGGRTKHLTPPFGESVGDLRANVFRQRCGVGPRPHGQRLRQTAAQKPGRRPQPTSGIHPKG